MKIYSHYNACICVVLSSMLFCVIFISLRVSIKDVDTCVVVAAAATATAVVPHTPKISKQRYSVCVCRSIRDDEHASIVHLQRNTRCDRFLFIFYDWNIFSVTLFNIFGWHFVSQKNWWNIKGDSTSIKSTGWHFSSSTNNVLFFGSARTVMARDNFRNKQEEIKMCTFTFWHFVPFKYGSLIFHFPVNWGFTTHTIERGVHKFHANKWSGLGLSIRKSEVHKRMCSIWSGGRDLICLHKCSNFSIFFLLLGCSLNEAENVVEAHSINRMHDKRKNAC